MNQAKSVVNGLAKKEGCWWCGAPLTGRRYRYCCDEHAHLYAINVFWPYAKEEAIRNSGGVCHECGKQISSADCEVHHIEELNGEDRSTNIKNRQENLVVLCHSCHWSKDYHGRKDTAKEDTPKKNKFETEVVSGQLVLAFMQKGLFDEPGSGLH